MIIITGGAGFIGSNLLKGLNLSARKDILVVDDLTDGKKYKNLTDCEFLDYLDAEDFLHKIIHEQNFSEQIDAIFHEGACSTTTEWNGRYMMKNNYDYSKHLLHYCANKKIPLIYASSAAVYGANGVFKESNVHEEPLNVYGYSKWLFDQYVLRMRPKLSSQVVGLRYFNVFGPKEQHKGSMASVAYHWMHQLHQTNIVKLFEGSHGYAHGEQKRDFIFVEDIVNVNRWFFENRTISGIFNVGTGKARSFNDVARCLVKLYGSGKIEYIPFPEHLKNAYQSFTQADMTQLQQAGYQASFTSLEQGLEKYYQWMKKNGYLPELITQV